MNIPTLESRRQRVSTKDPGGFALVVTISIMVLLALVAVGLLSLSTVVLRSASQDQDLAEARANARMALILAVGELQKTLGPDKAVSATGALVSETPNKRGLMGVWESWDYTEDLDDAPDYDGEKDRRFKAWLVSTGSPKDGEEQSFAAEAWTGETITLAGANSYGGVLPEEGAIQAGKVPVIRNGEERGSFAWHVSDESVKTRINLYRDPGRNDTLARQRSLLAGFRPDVLQIGEGLDFLETDEDVAAYQKAAATSGKITSLDQAELSGSGGLNRLKSLRDVVTPYSAGVLSNVRTGGLKKDLSALFEMSDGPNEVSLPGEFDNKGVYQTTHGITGESDPTWSRLASCYNVFKEVMDSESGPTFMVLPRDRVSVPRVGRVPRQPEHFAPGPVVAKVQMLFSMVTRPPHNGQQDNGRSGQLHMMYTPLVTLHNPYNVNISFDMLEVRFESLPLGFNFYRNGIAINGSAPEPFNELYHAARTGQHIAKAIVMKISNWKDYDRTRTQNQMNVDERTLERQADAESNEEKDPVIMHPGETILCSPYLNPQEEFGLSGTGANHRGSVFFDYGNQLTRSIKAKPGFFGNSIGFDLDWFGGRTHGNFERAPVDTGLRVSCSAAKPTKGDSASFEIHSEITVNGQKRGYGGIQMIYPDIKVLEGLLSSVTFETTARRSFVPSGGSPDAMISSHSGAQPFALFSAFARTSSGGVNERGQRSSRSMRGRQLLNGTYAGRPYLFHNPAAPVISIDLDIEAPGAQSYELSLEPVNKGTLARLLQIDANNRTRFVTGNLPENGMKFGSYLEVATGPLQAIADFRRSNVLASGFAPSMVQPISNSTVPPVMRTAEVAASGPGYTLLDHSFLANHALYDGFYFSTFASDGALSPADSFQRFMEGEKLLSQAFSPRLEPGATINSAKTELFSGGKPKDDAYLNSAKFQLVEGAFNVNSTSVPAWKARLAAMRGTSVPVMLPESGRVSGPEETEQVPILSMTLPNGEAMDLGLDPFTDDGRENRWSGFRELSEDQLDELAVRIVEQVRKRGPFLSMSEFVNRRVGPTSEETLRGPLETAIERAGLNEGIYDEIPGQLPIELEHISDPAKYGFLTPEVVLGNPAAGAPGWISQGDIMKLLEPAATVRSDTFVIRVCGEGGSGDRRIRVFAEAVVQRYPEYVDPSLDASLNAYDESNEVNRKFGRRLEIVSFRWLNSSEI